MPSNGRRYRPLIRSSRCLYCDDWADVQDHVCAWARTRDPRTVPACSDCNGLLSDAYVDDLGERVEILLRRFDRKYERAAPVAEALEGTSGWLRERLEAEFAAWVRLAARRTVLVSRASAFLGLTLDRLIPDEVLSQRLTDALRASA